MTITDSDLFERDLPAQGPPPGLQRARTVAVLGLGYVGLPTALGLHDAGHRVLGIDCSPARLKAIRAGAPDLLESDHARLRRARRARDRFVLTADEAALAEADAVLVCVPTPIDNRQIPDLGPLRAATETLVQNARAGQLHVLTSTTYVGCTRDLLVRPLAERGLVAGDNVHVCFAPERIDPANADYELSRVPKVIGGVTETCALAGALLFERISECVRIVSSPEAAEMTKLLENTFRAVNVTLANEIADISREFGLDPLEVIDAAATKPYGFMPFYPGPGVGGHCIPCDPHYLLWQLRDQRLYPPVISAAMQGIAMRPARIVQRAGEVLEHSERPLRGARVLVAGLAYKPNVADSRESPALEVVAGLRRRGARVDLYDPVVGEVMIDRAPERTLAELGEIGRYDLVVVTCLHDCFDADLLASASLILDATYRLAEASNRFVP